MDFTHLHKAIAPRIKGVSNIRYVADIPVIPTVPRITPKIRNTTIVSNGAEPRARLRELAISFAIGYPGKYRIVNNKIITFSKLSNATNSLRIYGNRAFTNGMGLAMSVIARQIK